MNVRLELRFVRRIAELRGPFVKLRRIKPRRNVLLNSLTRWLHDALIINYDGGALASTTGSSRPKKIALGKLSNRARNQGAVGLLTSDIT